jgi:phosphatidylserine decarboxylase
MAIGLVGDHSWYAMGAQFFVPLVILGLAGLALSIAWSWFAVPGILFLFLACFVAFFFRDPEREVPLEPGIVVAPADGKVTLIKDSAGRERERLVSIFLSILTFT